MSEDKELSHDHFIHAAAAIRKGHLAPKEVGPYSRYEKAFDGEKAEIGGQEVTLLRATSDETKAFSGKDDEIEKVSVAGQEEDFVVKNRISLDFQQADGSQRRLTLQGLAENPHRTVQGYRLVMEELVPSEASTEIGGLPTKEKTSELWSSYVGSGGGWSGIGKEALAGSGSDELAIRAGVARDMVKAIAGSETAMEDFGKILGGILKANKGIRAAAKPFEDDGLAFGPPEKGKKGAQLIDPRVEEKGAVSMERRANSYFATLEELEKAGVENPAGRIRKAMEGFVDKEGYDDLVQSSGEDKGKVAAEKAKARSERANAVVDAVVSEDKASGDEGLQKMRKMTKDMANTFGLKTSMNMLDAVSPRGENASETK